MTFEVRAVRPEDRDSWRQLFNGYGDFYNTPVTDPVAERVWSWLLDPGHVMEGLLAIDPQGQVVGMAHVRACPRSLAGAEIGFLDDLFVSPEARGAGAADALFEALAGLARDRGWGGIRWITQHFNERGRGFYDKYTGGPSDFIVYNWAQS